MKRLIAKLLLIDAVVELTWVLLKWSDNKRKGKTVSDFWSYMWVMFIYGEVNGRVPLEDIERGWREGTWFEYRGKRRGWRGPVCIDTPYGTIYKGRKVLDARW